MACVFTGPPRLQEGSAGVPEYLNYNGDPVVLVIPLTVFPAPQTQTLDYLGPQSNSMSSQPAREGLYNLHCGPSDAIHLYWTMCSLTITSPTPQDLGFYRITLANPFGNTSFVFKLENNTAGMDFVACFCWS